MNKCKCGKEFETPYQLGGHKSHCIVYLGKEKYNEYNLKRKINNQVGWSRGLTKETDERIAKMSKSLKGKGHSQTQATKQRLSEVAKHRKFGGYNKGSGRGKQGWYKGIWCDSSYELAFVIYNLEHNISFKRNKDKFVYEYNGKSYRYTPDFKIGNTYIEIKGFKTEKDTYKWNSCSNLKVLFKEDLQKEFDYVITKYGKDYIRLYEHGRVL